MPAESATQRSSRVRYTLRGACVGERLPERTGTSPVNVYSAACGPSTENSGSNSDRSISRTCGSAACRCWCSAASASVAPYRPATLSAMAKGGSTGGRSAKPFIAAKPLIASINEPKPPLSANSPVCPQPEMRTTTSRGFNACSAARPRPMRSSVPGRKFSTSTCARASSERSASMPSGVRRSSSTLSLLRL